MAVTRSERETWLRRVAQAWLVLAVLVVMGIVTAVYGWDGVLGIGAVTGLVGTIVSLAYLMDV